MGNENSKTWLFENVLFLDPNVPPFISQEEFERRLAESSENYDPYNKLNQAAKDKRVVKRTAPAQIYLRTRSFRVLVDIGGRNAEFNLQCLNEPLVFSLCDKQDRELRRLPASLVRRMERNQNAVSCEFANPESDKTRIHLTFHFFDNEDTQSFVDTTKLLYGIFVYQYGITRRDTDKQNNRSVVRCSIHGNVPCRCNPNRPKPITIREDLISPDLTIDFPITIAGQMESGSIVRWKDLSSLGRSHLPKAIEWRVSYIPGREPEFASEANESGGVVDAAWNAILDDQLLLMDFMVGKFIQVRVTRRVKDPLRKSPISYSSAIRGPVTFNDQEAATVLSIITTPNYTTAIELSHEQTALLFPHQEDKIETISLQQPFIQGFLIISREGITIDISRLINDVMFLKWNSFYVTRLTASQSDLGNEEDLYLQIHIKRVEKREIVIRLAAISLKERNSIYHGFDRWAQDLARGNFSVFKQRYAKLWEATSFYEDIVQSLELLSNEPTMMLNQFGNRSQDWSASVLPERDASE